MKCIIIFGENTEAYTDFIEVLQQNYHFLFSSKMDNLLLEGLAAVMVFERKYLELARDFADKEKIPLFFVAKVSLLRGQFSLNPFLIDQMLLIQDSTLDRISSNEFTSILHPPCVIPHNLPNKEYRWGMRNVLFYIENIFHQFDPIYNIIDLINTLTKLNVTVLSDKQEITNLFNEGIKVYHLDHHMETHIIRADIVVGSGSIIRKAIAMKKPAIVLGVNGYGGFVGKENIQHLFESQFHGRPGGSINELIPRILFYDDFFRITERPKKDLEDTLVFNRDFLKKKNQNFISAVELIIQNAIDLQQKIGALNEFTRISKSTIFDINSIGSGSYVIVNKESKQFHSIIKEEEYNVIQKFNAGELLGKVSKGYGYNHDMKMFKDFIVELIKEKILIIE